MRKRQGKSHGRAWEPKPKPKPDAQVLAAAIAAHQAGRFAEAAPVYDSLLSEDPRNFQVLQVAGVLSFQTGDFRTAEKRFRKALEVSPGNHEALNNLGNVLRRAGEVAESVRCFEGSLAAQPNSPHAHSNLGGALVAQGKLEEAIVHLDRAIELDPNMAQAWLELVSPLAFMSRFEEALAAFVRAAELGPELIPKYGAGVYELLGQAYAAFGHEPEAVECVRQSLEMRQASGDSSQLEARVCSSLGLSCQHNGRLADALKWFQKAIDACPDDPSAHSNLFWCLQYDNRHDPAFVRDRTVEWANRFAPVSLARKVEMQPLDGRKLRIGYLSPEFRDHPVAYCIEAMLESHDRSKFEIDLYANTAQPDDVSKRLEARADRWFNIAALSDDEAADLIEKNEVDVLVDLTGHTENNRVGVFARKPAPIQAEWLGYYATSGLPQMDYFICNPALIPPEEEALYVEKPMRLAGKAFSFKPPEEEIPVPPLPALSGEGVTFGCHNYLAKVTPEVVGVWSQVLLATPGSRFVMNRHAFIHPHVRDYYRDLFVAGGVEADRIVFQSTSSRREYLESLGKLDVLLDTFPFNGATSIYEALWMGLPVVTMTAPRMVGHFGESILVPLGYPEWVARDAEDYVAKAVALVSNVDALAKLRKRLRKKFVESALCDAPAFTKEMESAFERMVKAAAGIR